MSFDELVDELTGRYIELFGLGCDNLTKLGGRVDFDGFKVGWHGVGGLMMG